MDRTPKDVANKLFQENPAWPELDLMRVIAFNERIRDTGLALKIIQEYREIQLKQTVLTH